MKKWAFIVTVGYAALVTTIFIPVFFWLTDLIAGEKSSFSDYWSVWFFVVTVIVIVLQALLLLYRVPKLKERPKPQRVLWIPAAVSGVLFSLLWLGVIASGAAAIWGDEQEVKAGVFWIWGFIPISWVIWSALFYSFSKTTNHEGFFNKVMQMLVRGSILELLVALPCHIIVRHKEECCAPGFTFYGIAAGLSVMTIAYGPAVYFVFLKRLNQLHPKRNTNLTEPSCDLVKQPVLTVAFLRTILVVILVIGLCIVYGWGNKANEKYRMALEEKETLEKQIQELKKPVAQPAEKASVIIGKPFPPLEFVDLAGRTINVQNYLGKTVLIQFWSTTCGPCRAETPVLLDLYERFNKYGFEIIGISLDTDRNALDRYLAEHRITWPQYFDGGGWQNKIATRFDITGIPATILIDQNGNVSYRCLRGDRLKAVIEELYSADLNKQVNR